jgi:hypothetical protein
LGRLIVKFLKVVKCTTPKKEKRTRRVRRF